MSDHLNFIIQKMAKSIQTPFYLYDLEALETNFSSFKQSWSQFLPNFRIAYSYKSNSLENILSILHKNGAYAEVVSGMELEKAILHEVEGKNIFFDGPVKKDWEIKKAIKYNVNLQIDSLDELQLIKQLSIQMNVVPNISFRLATFYKEKYLSRLGLSKDEYIKAFLICQSFNCNTKGFHFHVGSNISSPQPYIDALIYFKDIFEQYRQNIGENFWIDIGGGFPANSVGKNITRPSVSLFAKSISECLKTLNLLNKNIEIILEPGRCIVEDFGYLITTVYAKKERNYNSNIIVVDAGINLARSIHTWYHPIEIIKKSSTDHIERTYSIFGSNCFEQDCFNTSFVYRGKINTKDIIKIGSTGGYDLANANIWIRKLPNIYGYYENKYFLINNVIDIED